MTLKEIKRLTAELERAEQNANTFVSNGTIAMILAAYPNLDGVQDAETASEFMALEQTCRALATSCEYLSKIIKFVLEEDEKE